MSTYWEKDTLQWFLDQNLLQGVPEEVQEAPEEENGSNLADALARDDSHTALTGIPEWLQGSRLRNPESSVLTKGKFQRCVISMSGAFHGSLSGDCVNIKLNGSLYVPYMRLRFKSEDKSEQMQMEIDPDSCCSIKVESNSLSSLNAKLEAAGLCKADVRENDRDHISRITFKFKPGEELSVQNMMSTTDVSDTVVVHGTETIAVRTHTFLAEGTTIMNIVKMLAESCKTGSEVSIWVVDHPRDAQVVLWNRSILARRHASGEPSNAWFYTQLALSDEHNLDKFRGFLDAAQAPPIPPFLEVAPSSTEWRKCGYWVPIAHPIAWYPSRESFLNSILPAILTEAVEDAATLDSVFNQTATHPARIKVLGNNLMVTVASNNVVNGGLVLPAIGTEVEAFLTSDALRTNATRLTGFVHRIRPSGSEFEFVAAQRPAPHQLLAGRYDLVVLLVRIDTRIRAHYEACVQAMVGQTAHEAMGFLSIKNLLLNGRSASSPPPSSLFSKWRYGAQDANQPAGLRVQSKLIAARSTLSEMQKKVYDTIIFGKPVNATTLVQGPGGTGKTHVLLASLAGLLAMGFKALLVCKEENTADCLASRTSREIPRNEVCRYYPPGMVEAYAKRASTLGYEEGRLDFQGETLSAWDLRQRSDKHIEKAKVVVASVNGCEAVVEAGFNPDVIIIDEASLIIDAELCLPLVAARQSVLAVVIAGDPNQCRPHFISESVNTHFPALSFCPLERLKTDNAERSTFYLKENFRQVPELGELYNKLAHDKDRMTFIPRPSPVLVNNVNWAISNQKLPFNSNHNGQREFFLDVAWTSITQKNAHSISNEGGVSAIVDVINCLIKRAGANQDQIGVISPYSYDVVKLREGISGAGFSKIPVYLIKYFQGRSRPIMIVHAPKANACLDDHENPFGLLTDPRQLRTALSRAEEYNIFVGYWSLLVFQSDWAHVKKLSKKYKSFQELLSHASSTHRIVQYKRAQGIAASP